MITPADLTPVEATLATRILAYARSIAPCLNTLSGDDRNTAIALLKGVAAEVPVPGSSRVKSQRVGSGAVEFFEGSSAFSDDDRAALRALCAASSGGLPVGSFPEPARVISRLWPEC